jgi:hypothetical protein
MNGNSDEILFLHDGLNSFLRQSFDAIERERESVKDGIPIKPIIASIMKELGMPKMAQEIADKLSKNIGFTPEFYMQIEPEK